MNDDMRKIEVLANNGYTVQYDGETMLIILADGFTLDVTDWSEARIWTYCCGQVTLTFQSA